MSLTVNNRIVTRWLLAALIIWLASCNSLNTSQSGMHGFTPREHIVEVVNKLFVYTDEQDWSALHSEVFAGQVLFDMVSVGAKSVETKTAAQITELWRDGFAGLDAVHHQAGNYIVSIDGASARVKAYAIASHFKDSAREGKVREFVGSYDIGLLKQDSGWRIHEFKYNLKYLDGNLELK